MNNNFITRKEITVICPVLKYDWIRRHEKECGLFQCRVRFMARPILYQRSKVMVVLVNIGLIPAELRQDSPVVPNDAT